MGNTEISVFKEYEHQSGSLLLVAIKMNNRKKLQDAIDYARKQMITPNLKKSYDEDYKEMAEKMLTYLTRKYDVGDGLLHRKTPLEFAQSIGSDDVVELLNETIQKLQSSVDECTTRNTEKYESISKNIGKIDKDRVELAKSRLEKLRGNANK